MRNSPIQSGSVPNYCLRLLSCKSETYFSKIKTNGNGLWNEMARNGNHIVSNTCFRFNWKLITLIVQVCARMTSWCSYLFLEYSSTGYMSLGLSQYVHWYQCGHTEYACLCIYRSSAHALEHSLYECIKHSSLYDCIAAFWWACECFGLMKNAMVLVVRRAERMYTYQNDFCEQVLMLIWYEIKQKFLFTYFMSLKGTICYLQGCWKSF